MDQFSQSDPRSKNFFQHTSIKPKKKPMPVGLKDRRDSSQRQPFNILKFDKIEEYRTDSQQNFHSLRQLNIKQVSTLRTAVVMEETSGSREGSKLRNT